ncbi:hypothetical protein EPA93_22105 [Ktedonosporobacter rubrisoli]|uniref:Uncharacterized protein n=1 Tax=Ktedonosporobacter rubrisoli TaxID=2509675 RepID=A0A4P6JTC2_KTERU|nr:hypothetical protein [Ktedonosporobacter rubrisoli]QBD78540.1 hypothetical protein EPA93_22105 [Ktedonosporobacter rubrisoli]
MKDVGTPLTGDVKPAAWKIWVKTGRPMTLTATASPILVGTALAAYEGTFHIVTFLLTLGQAGFCR